MFARHLSLAAKLASATIAGVLLLSSASFAGSGYNDDRFYGHRYYDESDSRARALIPYSTPSDYSSSHVCINGYRWITRRLSPNDTPEQNAIPVPCN